jgi:hypothetical protein
LTKTEKEIQREREEKAVRLDNWSRLDMHRWSEDPKVDEVVEKVYGLMKSLQGFSGKSNIQKKHLKVILLNLYSNYLEDPQEYTGFYRRVSNYRPYSRYNRLGISKTTIKVVNCLLTLDLIDHEKGHYFRDSVGKSHMSRMRAKPSLIRIFVEFKWTDLSVERATTTECIILREVDPLGNVKVELEYDDNNDTRRMRTSLTRYNNLLRRTCIDIPEFPTEGVLSTSGSRTIHINRTNKFVRRVFNNGNWEDGGRFYGPWWQNIPKQWREMIRIEDEQTIEWDYSGLHIVLLYALKEMNYWEIGGGDPYQLPDRESSERLRRLLKIILLVAINAQDMTKTLRGIHRHINLDLEEYGWVREEGLEIRELVNEFAERHQPIKEYFFSGKGVRLQNFDSRIAELVIKELTTRGIPCLTIHDSFITTRQEEQYLGLAMDKAIVQGVQEILGTQVSNRMKRRLAEEEVTPWERLKLLNRPFEDREKLDDHWQEQREWVIGLENGKYSEYEKRLNRHRSAMWAENYYQPVSL